MNQPYLRLCLKATSYITVWEEDRVQPSQLRMGFWYGNFSCVGHNGLVREKVTRGPWASTFLQALGLGKVGFGFDCLWWIFFIFKFSFASVLFALEPEYHQQLNSKSPVTK